MLTIRAPVQTISTVEQVAKSNQKPITTESKDLSKSRNSSVYGKANAETDRVIQKVINLVQDKNMTIFARVPHPWSDKLNSFSVDGNGLLYIWITVWLFLRTWEKTC